MDLGSSEVTCREHEVVACDDVEHAGKPVLCHPHGLARNAGRHELVLDLAPDRLLGGLRAVLARFVLGVDGRKPDDPRPTARCDLHRQRVQPTDTRVERDRAERVDTGNRRAHDSGALGGRNVVRLEHEPCQPDVGEAAGKGKIVDPPLRQIGLDVDVQVVGAANELTSPGGSTVQWPASASSASSSGTGGVPLMWNEAIVFIPHACPFARSACDQITGS